jgi:2-polyprenyl-3-methyl-5-hydroxy-6-metoxy-1,4-benzoquinol methylase
MNLPNVEITYLRGARAKDDNAASLLKVNVLQTIPRLAETISEYGLVLTHYGITAYEALYAGTPVLLLPPTAYHKKLAKAAGFCSVKGVNRIFRGNFLQKLEKTCKTLAVKYGLDKEGTNLAALVSGFSPQVNRRCPVCGEAPGRSVSRFPERTYRRCPRCGVIYMDRTCPPPIEYEREYFFESYRRQYGKTYIEDFPNIKAAGKRRLKIIKSLLPAGERRSLLDIGCAYGPFLAAASEEGFSPAGIDPAEDAVRYVQQNLAVPAVHGFFPGSPLPVPAPYDVITLWYVIEHFSDCAAALAEIRNILRPGGILAFSTPSFSGVSGRTSLRRFLDASPADHRTIWSPKMCRKALALAGFKVKKIVISGHHGERFPLLGKFAKSKKSPLYRPLLAASKIFALGDTFEVYAQALPKKERT